MRFRTWAAIVVQSVVIGCSPAPDRASQEQRVKPIIENIIEISHAEPPPTLREVFADPEVGAIARVTVTSRRAADRTFPGYVAGVQKELVCEYELSVGDVFRPHAGVQRGATIELLGTSAEMDRGDHIERTLDRAFPMLEVNHEYLLLLRWYERQSSWRVGYGPFGVWDLEGGMARCLKMSRLCRSLGGLAAADLFDQLHRAR